MTMLSDIGTAANAVTAAAVALRAAQTQLEAGKTGEGDVAEKRATYEAAQRAEAAAVTGYAADPEPEG